MNHYELHVRNYISLKTMKGYLLSAKRKTNKQTKPVNLESYAQGKTKSERLLDEQQLKEFLNSKCSTGNAILHDLPAEGNQVELGLHKEMKNVPKW